MVTVLVVDAGTLNVEYHVNAVSFCVDVEELASDGDRSWEGVLGIVGTLRSCQSTGGEFTCKVSSAYNERHRQTKGKDKPR